MRGRLSGDETLALFTLRNGHTQHHMLETANRGRLHHEPVRAGVAAESCDDTETLDLFFGAAYRVVASKISIRTKRTTTLMMLID